MTFLHLKSLEQRNRAWKSKNTRASGPHLLLTQRYSTKPTLHVSGHVCLFLHAPSNTILPRQIGRHVCCQRVTKGGGSIEVFVNFEGQSCPCTAKRQEGRRAVCPFCP